VQHRRHINNFADSGVSGAASLTEDCFAPFSGEQTFWQKTAFLVSYCLYRKSAPASWF
jgi:hypothetical protein